MNSRKLFSMVVATALLALGVAACGSDDSTGSDSTGAASDSSLSGEIAGAGSSAQEAAQEAWIAGIQDASPDVSIAYDPVGSGGGREQFIAGGVDYAGTDSAFEDQELTDAQKRCTDQSGEMIQIPVYISAIAVVYNLPEVENLQLSPETLAGIFDQKITNWNDPAIAKDNPDAKLPDQRITVVNRSDESGTTENFQQYLAAVAPSVWDFEVDGNWPVKGGEAAEGTSGVVAAVKAGKGAIGYADASQAGELGVAKIKVGSQWAEPTPEAAAKILEESPADKALAKGPYMFPFELDRKTASRGTYPIVLVSYLIACTKYDSASEAEIVKGYLRYAISAEGQEVAAENAGSAPLSAALTEKVEPAVEAIEAG